MLAYLFFGSVLLIYTFLTSSTLLSAHKFFPIMGDLLIIALGAIIFMSGIFFVAKRIGRYDLVDTAWGPLFLVIALISFLLSYQTTPYLNVCMVVVLLIAVWGWRLAWHIIKRLHHTTEEDSRYVALRKNWRGNVAVNMFFRVYLVQVLLALVISIPVIHINLFIGTDWTVWSYVGLMVWVVGFIVESVSDRQLERFVGQSQNKGKILQTGLWKYSRHPNYFGELVGWWGIFIIALGVPFGWVGVVGPITITFLILFISGIPPTEKRFEGRPGWKVYKARTSMLIPLPPKS